MFSEQDEYLEDYGFLEDVPRYEYDSLLDEYKEIRNENTKLNTKIESLNEVNKMLQDSYKNICEVNETLKNKHKKVYEGEKIMENNKNGIEINKMFEGFGKIKDESVVLTMSGQIAIKRNDNEYIRYDMENKKIENQMNLVLKESKDFIYILPVDKVQIGDIIKQKNTYYQVLDIKNNEDLKVVNIKTGTKTTVVKETNIFGFNFYYKVVCLFNMNDNSTTEGLNPMMLAMLEDDKEDSILPFLLMGLNNSNNGSINPMMLMLMNKSEEDGDFDMKDLLMLQMMNGNNNSINPMMLLMMKSNKGMNMKDLLLMQMMSQNNSNMFMNNIKSQNSFIGETNINEENK